jgi:hypothetical protein
LRTERKLLVNARPDNVRVDDKAVGHIVKSQKDRVGQQELKGISVRRMEDITWILTISGISIRRIAPVAISKETMRPLTEDSKQMERGKG